MEETNENNLSLEEKWKNATISNNFIFYKVMRNNPDVCKELLEILLEIQIDHIDMKQEDVDSLPAGAKYKDLKDTYIIFICVPDIFGKGLYKYKFENLCVDNPEIKLNDRAYKYFFIAENYDKIKDERQKAFLKLVIDNQPTNAFADKISKLVDDAKHNTQWRKQFMDWEIEKAYSFDAGKKEGEQMKAIEDARSFYENGASIELIAKSLHMTEEQVREIVETQVSVKA